MKKKILKGRIIRGKHKGKIVKLCQWGIDWITAEVDGKVEVFGRNSIERIN